jgi:hypothetical protein
MGTRHHSADAVGELASSQLLPFFSPAKQLITNKKTMLRGVTKATARAEKQQQALRILVGEAVVAQSCHCFPGRRLVFKTHY